VRSDDGVQESVVYVHSYWKKHLGEEIPGVRYFSSVDELPDVAKVVAPSPKADRYFRSIGLDVIDHDFTPEGVKEVISQYLNAGDERKVVTFRRQSEVVQFLETFMQESGFFVYNGRIVHLTSGGIRDVDRDYLAREALRQYDFLFDGKDYIPADRLCGLALSGVSLRTVDVIRNYPLYLPVPNPRVLSPKVKLRNFTSKDEILENVEQYLALLRLPFQDIPSIASALAAALTPLVYTPCSPIWVVTSSTPGVGKTLLAQSILALAVGEILPVTPYPESEAEKRKQITSALLSSRPALIWDNLSTPLGGSSIDALTTSRSWRDRILGKSQMVEIPKFISLACTGNNVTLASDTYRRVIVTHLRPPGESPEKRYFSRDLVSECVKRHPEFVRDALSWLAFYEAQGCVPKRGFGSFEQWNQIVGGFVEWLLGVHPADTAETIVSEDHELLERLLSSFPYQEAVSLEQILADAQSTMFGKSNPSFVAVLKEISPTLNPKEISKWFKQREGLACKGKALCSTKSNLGRLYSVVAI